MLKNYLSILHAYILKYWDMYVFKYINKNVLQFIIIIIINAATAAAIPVLLHA